MRIDPVIFRAYDIRGTAGGNLSADVVHAISRAFAAEAQSAAFEPAAGSPRSLADDAETIATPPCLVGCDGRHSSPALKDAVIAGLTGSGVDVLDIGQVPTPLWRFAIHAENADNGGKDGNSGNGVMVTGSHSPADQNGLKLVLGGKRLAGTGITRLKRRIDAGNHGCQGERIVPEGIAAPAVPPNFATRQQRQDRFQDQKQSQGQDRRQVRSQAQARAKGTSPSHGRIKRANLARAYINSVLADVQVTQPLNVVVDCGNGVAGAIAPQLLRELGCEVLKLFCDIDGNFPNHHPDPAEPANLQALMAAVKDSSAHCGIAFDGDGDRIGVVTSQGGIVWPDELMMMLAQDIIARRSGAGIVYDVKCSHRLGELVRSLGGRPILCRTGTPYIEAKLRETGALLSGEFAGHICFGERWFGFDDALYAAARLLELLSRHGGIDHLFEQLPKSCATPELKIAVTDTTKFEIIDTLTKMADFGEGALTAIDGLRVDYADGWGLIRASNTGPALTLRFEANSKPALARIQHIFQAQLAAVHPTLRFL